MIKSNFLYNIACLLSATIEYYGFLHMISLRPKSPLKLTFQRTFSRFQAIIAAIFAKSLNAPCRYISGTTISQAKRGIFISRISDAEPGGGIRVFSAARSARWLSPTDSFCAQGSKSALFICLVDLCNVFKFLFFFGQIAAVIVGKSGFCFQLAVGIPTLQRKLAVGDGLIDGASRLRSVRTIPKFALSEERFHIVEAFFKPRRNVPHAQFPHAGRVDDNSSVRKQQDHKIRDDQNIAVSYGIKYIQ